MQDATIPALLSGVAVGEAAVLESVASGRIVEETIEEVKLEVPDADEVELEFELEVEVEVDVKLEVEVEIAALLVVVDMTVELDASVDVLVALSAVVELEEGDVVSPNIDFTHSPAAPEYTSK